MSDPIKYCTACGRVRSCYQHMRAEFPPGAAEKWLRKSCPAEGKPCEIKYQAGMSPDLMAYLHASVSGGSGLPGGAPHE